MKSVEFVKFQEARKVDSKPDLFSSFDYQSPTLSNEELVTYNSKSTAAINWSYKTLAANAYTPSFRFVLPLLSEGYLQGESYDLSYDLPSGFSYESLREEVQSRLEFLGKANPLKGSTNDSNYGSAVLVEFLLYLEMKGESIDWKQTSLEKFRSFVKTKPKEWKEFIESKGAE